MGRNQNKILTISLVVLGAVLFAMMAPYSDWGWDKNNNVEIPTVSASWTGGGTADSLARITIASPPYIILEAIPNQGQHMDRRFEIRVSIQTMSGSYSEYLASTLAAPKGRPISFVSSQTPGSYGDSPLGPIAWE